MQLCFEQVIELPRSALFAFYEDPAHLAVLHGADRRFRMIRHDGDLRPGSETWFEINIGGVLPIAMGFQHTIYDPPCRFAERLIHGPFSRFNHAHEFEEVASGTRLRDLLDISLPTYYGGEAIMRIVIAPRLRHVFEQRARALQKLVQSGAIPTA